MRQAIVAACLQPDTLRGDTPLNKEGEGEKVEKESKKP